MDLAELLDRLDPRELEELACEFNLFTAVHNSRVSRWARWWLWRSQRALGEQTEQPPGELIDVMYGNEREAITADLLALAERHRLDDGVVAFCAGMAAQLGFRALDDEAERQNLRATIDEYRRQHPYGAQPSDTSHIQRDRRSAHRRGDVP
jgi:hypothetical protein